MIILQNIKLLIRGAIFREINYIENEVNEKVSSGVSLMIKKAQFRMLSTKLIKNFRFLIRDKKTLLRFKKK